MWPVYYMNQIPRCEICPNYPWLKQVRRAALYTTATSKKWPMYYNCAPWIESPRWLSGWILVFPTAAKCQHPTRNRCEEHTTGPTKKDRKHARLESSANTDTVLESRSTFAKHPKLATFAKHPKLATFAKHPKLATFAKCRSQVVSAESDRNPARDHARDRTRNPRKKKSEKQESPEWCWPQVILTSNRGWLPKKTGK
jgi:hypothetical protein